MLLIHNATNNWTKLFFFFFYPHYIGESAKLFLKKNQSCNTPVKLDTILFAQNMLDIMYAFYTTYACSQNARIPERAFLQTTLLISGIVRVKIEISFSRWWRLELATAIALPNLLKFSKF